MSGTQAYTPIQGARWMAKQGLPIIPLNGKIPFGNAWQDAATNDVTELDTLAQTHKGNYGCVAKKGEFWMVDEDVAGFFERFTRETGIVLDTLFVNSSAGRRHGYFQATAESDELFGKNIPEKLLNGEASVRWHNQQCVCPFSIHPTHKTPYLPVDIKATIKPAPIEFIKWILAQCTKVEPTSASSSPVVRVPRGQHDTTLASIAGALRAAGANAEEIEPVLIRAVEETFDDYGSDYREMAHKVARSIGKKPAGYAGPTVTIEGKLPGEGPTACKDQTREERKAS